MTERTQFQSASHPISKMQHTPSPICITPHLQDATQIAQPVAAFGRQGRRVTVATAQQGRPKASRRPGRAAGGDLPRHRLPPGRRSASGPHHHLSAPEAANQGKAAAPDLRFSSPKSRPATGDTLPSWQRHPLRSIEMSQRRPPASWARPLQRGTIDASRREIVNARRRLELVALLSEPGRHDSEAIDDAWGGPG